MPGEVPHVGTQAVLVVDAHGDLQGGSDAAAVLLAVPVGALGAGALGALVGTRAGAVIGAMAQGETEVVARRPDGGVLALGVAVIPAGDGVRRLVLTDLCRPARGSFPGVVAETVRDTIHALRNPLAAAMNSLDLMTHQITRPEDLPSLQRVIRNGLERTDRLLSHLRELVQLRVDRAQPVDVVDLVRLVTARATARADVRGVTVALAVRTSPGMRTSGDGDALAEALDGLVANAVDASAPGDAVTVTVARDVAAREAVVTVRDEGEGISPERMKNVFRVFFTTRKDQGSDGVGLTRARWVIAAHSGSLGLTSTAGQGTTVTVRLPV